jgi:hypothetical protein
MKERLEFVVSFEETHQLRLLVDLLQLQLKSHQQQLHQFLEKLQLYQLFQGQQLSSNS